MTCGTVVHSFVVVVVCCIFFFQAEDGIRDRDVTGVRRVLFRSPLQQFQVLFNSLFKVLCIFPSRYLCAIGLPPVFSFRWNLPPTLSCNPKQLDSLSARAMTHKLQARTGVSPSQLPFSKGLGPEPRSTMPLQTTIRRARLHGKRRFTW